MKFKKRISLYLELEKCLKEGEFICTKKRPCCDGLKCVAKKCKDKDAPGNEN